MSRRLLLAGLSASTLTAPSCAADDFPTRPVRIVVPYPPGGSTDTIARIVGQQVAKTIGQPVVIENKPGAASAVGSLFVARSSADGYTLLLGTGTLAINKSLRKDLGYDVETDLALVANAAGGPFLLLVHPDFPAKTVAELIAYAKANPGKINFGSPGAGTQNHLAGELFATMAGIKMVHVPYRGEGLGVTAAYAKEIELMVATYSAGGAFVQDGKLRALAVTSAARDPMLPNVPTVAEDGLPGYAAAFWNGFLAPAGTPKPVIDELSKEFNAALRSDDVKDRFGKLGLNIIEQTPDEFRALIVADVAKWAKVVEATGLKARD
jgi:tripartite-type tricarboxylate transporter receptor subunit TctC